MIPNRSSPTATVIPVLTYADVAEASEWLCEAFGFRERLRIGHHRVQLVFGDGAVIVTERSAPANGPGTASAQTSHGEFTTHSVHVRVEDATAHHAQAVDHGARIIRELADHPYGERQYSAVDIGGHVWTFSQSIADVDPASWGGTAMDLG
ncbi:MAG: VOC family protein [Candidatus Limnocylindria bacterium]